MCHGRPLQTCNVQRASFHDSHSIRSSNSSTLPFTCMATSLSRQDARSDVSRPLLGTARSTYPQYSPFRGYSSLSRQAARTDVTSASFWTRSFDSQVLTTQKKCLFVFCFYHQGEERRQPVEGGVAGRQVGRLLHTLTCYTSDERLALYESSLLLLVLVKPDTKFKALRSETSTPTSPSSSSSTASNSG